jgi:Aspartyl protease
MKTIATFLPFIIAGCSGLEASRLTGPVVVPFELRGDYAIVSVEVNGHPTLLILDTGSGALVLDSAFARLAGVEWSRFMRGTAEGNSNASVRIGKARSVRVGTAAVPNARVAAVDFHDVQAKVGHDVQGALGYEVFERYVVAIDYQSKTITLYEPPEFQYTGSGAVIPITIEHRLPVINASVVTRTKGTIPARFHLLPTSVPNAENLNRVGQTREVEILRLDRAVPAERVSSATRIHNRRSRIAPTARRVVNLDG